jgi:hypothetical protein
MKNILPEAVRWRKNIGQHPRWKFYEQLVANVSQRRQDGWTLSIRDDGLKKWVDKEIVCEYKHDYEFSRDYDASQKILRLFILTWWLKSHRFGEVFGSP